MARGPRGLGDPAPSFFFVFGWWQAVGRLSWLMYVSVGCMYKCEVRVRTWIIMHVDIEGTNSWGCRLRPKGIGVACARPSATATPPPERWNPVHAYRNKKKPIFLISRPLIAFPRWGLSATWRNGRPAHCGANLDAPYEGLKPKGNSSLWVRN